MMTAAQRGDRAAGLYRLEWRLHAMQPQHLRRVKRSIDVIRQVLADSPRAFVSVSGGKDSVALLGLVRSVDPNIDVWHFDSGAESPDTKDVLAALQRDYGLRIIQPELSIVEMVQMVGGLGYGGDKKMQGEWHWRETDWVEVLTREPSRRLCAQYGYTVVFIGLRGDESRGRTMRMRKFGEVHVTKQGVTTVTPLAWWTGLDSLAYCESHGLPISQVYLRAEDTKPCDRRTASMLGMIGAESGRLAELKRRHPDEWQQLVSMFPKLRDYV